MTTIEKMTLFCSDCSTETLEKLKSNLLFRNPRMTEEEKLQVEMINKALEERKQIPIS